jgi:hypothetical protein
LSGNHPSHLQYCFRPQVALGCFLAEGWCLDTHTTAIVGIERTSVRGQMARPSAWVFACSVPVVLPLFLFALTLYSFPESDDFCLAFLNREQGFVGTVWIPYLTLSGRVVPLILIQIPSAISDATGIDFVSVTLPCWLASRPALQSRSDG